MAESSLQDDAPDFLQGGGEMGALMRAFDWSANPLGPARGWPQSLRTVVRLMLNTGHPMYIWWGPQGLCLYNDAYRQTIGPERHPGSIGRPAREVWEEIWDIIGPQIEQVMSGGGATWHVNQLVPITRNGRLEDVYWTYSYSPIDDKDAPDGVGGVLVLCTETTEQVNAEHRLADERNHLARLLTERSAAEQSLRESEARFRSALKAGRMGSWETDYGTMTRSWSAEGMELFGLSLVDGRGQVGGPDDEYVAALHPEDRHLAAHFRQVADQHDSFEAEYRIVRPDLSQLWLSGRGHVVSRDADGRALRLISIMADATERKRAEQQLRVEHDRLEIALSVGRMGTYDMNFEDGVLWWSPQTYALFGLDPGSFIPTPASVLALLHPDDRETYMRLRSEAIASGRPFIHEFRIRRPDGAEVWLGHRGQAQYDADGRPVRSYGITMDITERRKAEDRLREADQQKDRFIAILAHELRNPLAPIRNAVEVMRRQAPGTPGGRYHDIIDRQVRQMAHLLDDLLDSSRLSRGALRLRLQHLQLDQVIAQAVEIAQPHVDAGGHALSVRPATEPMELSGDLTRLAQVFSNILINAAKFTPRGGLITLASERRGELAVVTITDDGAGIEAEHLERIFEMFAQLDGGGSLPKGGQGIGLALAKGLVELHGGSIEAHSQGRGKGSCFEVRLPLIVSRPEPLADHDKQGPLAARHSILVVDDLVDSADSLAEALRSMGQQVDVAYSGEEALRHIGEARPDIVLLDLGLPGIDGYEVCRRIRQQAWGDKPLIVAQTGWGQQHDRDRTRAAGFDHHIVKPIEMGELLALLRDVRGNGRDMVTEAR